MPYYEWKGDGEFRDNRNDRTIAHGDVVELDAKLVGGHDFQEVDEPPGEVEESSEPESEGVEDSESEPEEITCAEGDCSRTVDEVGMKCWQHSE